MPEETKNAIEWSLTQQVRTEWEVLQVTVETDYLLVDKVREFFNENNIEYSTFSYDDLIPYLKDMGLLN